MTTRAALEDELLAWMRETPAQSGPAPSDDERFERIALALFRIQHARCSAYGRYADTLGRSPDRVEHADDVPAVPTDAFKELDLRAFPAARTRRTFRTSGTTRAGDAAAPLRGRLHLDTLELYEASLLASLRRCVLIDLVGKHPPMHFLAPSASDAPDSSLSYMFETLRREEGAAGSERDAFHLRDGRLDVASLRGAVEVARAAGGPVVLGGTSFAFVHLLDQTAQHATTDVTPPESWALPPGSRIVETGGFKGRSRELVPERLREAIAARFALPVPHVLNQYGMTELGSQFYDSTLVDPDGPRRKLAPPWARVRLLDPIDGGEVPAGEVGLIRVHDLANTGSVAAIQTADVGRAVLDAQRRPIGFEVLGRAQGVGARGCGLAVDALLAAAEDIPR